MRTMQVEAPLDFGGVPLRVGDQVEVMSSWGTVWEPHWDTESIQTVSELVLHIDETGEYWGALLDSRRREYVPEFLRHTGEE